MNLIKIGKYIADKRKGLGMTQKQLAEKLCMSDKSVSKWERGICLPDVSVYSDLCRILGISINEFLAGEDVLQENIIQQSEENIIGVTTDSKHKQNKLKTIICVLLVVSILVFGVIGIVVYYEKRPQNLIAPVAQDSIEMETARLFSGPDGAHIYRFTTTEEYKSIKLYISEYQAGKRIDKGRMELGFESIGSPENGAILIFPDFENYSVKIVIAAGGSKCSSEISILENVADRAYYGRSATEIQESTTIRYNEEQALAALIYDNDEMHVIDICDLMDESTDSLAENDYMYYFSFAFCTQ